MKRERVYQNKGFQSVVRALQRLSKCCPPINIGILFPRGSTRPLFLLLLRRFSLSLSFLRPPLFLSRFRPSSLYFSSIFSLAFSRCLFIFLFNPKSAGVISHSWMKLDDLVPFCDIRSRFLSRLLRIDLPFRCVSVLRIILIHFFIILSILLLIRCFCTIKKLSHSSRATARHTI